MLILFNVQFTIVTDGDAVLYNVHTVQCILLVPIVHRWAGRANFCCKNCVLPLISGKYLQGIFVAGWEPTMTLSEK